MDVLNTENIEEILALALQRIITYNECAQMLEEALVRKFPYSSITQQLPDLRGYCSSPQHYCRELVALDQRLYRGLRERCVG